MRNTLSLLTLSLLLTSGLSACVEMHSTPVPDYRVKVMVSPDGQATAVAPECPSWADTNMSPLDNQHWQQFGCANARNLANMVDNPKDLVEPREAGAADGTYGASAVDLYRTGKTKALLNPAAGSATTAGQ